MFFWNIGAEGLKGGGVGSRSLLNHRSPRTQATKSRRQIDPLAQAVTRWFAPLSLSVPIALRHPPSALAVHKVRRSDDRNSKER